METRSLSERLSIAFKEIEEKTGVAIGTITKTNSTQVLSVLIPEDCAIGIRNYIYKQIHKTFPEVNVICRKSSLKLKNGKPAYRIQILSEHLEDLQKQLTPLTEDKELSNENHQKFVALNAAVISLLSDEKESSPEKLASLLSQGADPNAQIIEPTYPGNRHPPVVTTRALGIAIAKKDKACMAVLLAHGADITHVAEIQYPSIKPTRVSALQRAVSPQKSSDDSTVIDIVKDLIKHGAKIEIDDTNNSFTEILRLPDERYLTMLKIFLENAIDIGLTQNDIDNALSRVITSLDPTGFRKEKFFSKLDLLLDSPYPYPLKKPDIAAAFLQALNTRPDKKELAIAVVKYFLENRNFKPTPEVMAEALTKAGAYGDKSLVDLLIGHGANVNLANERGITVLMAAAKAEQAELVEHLVSRYHATVTLQDYFQRNALMHCVDEMAMKLSSRGTLKTETFQYLLRLDPQLANAKDKLGETALTYLLKIRLAPLPEYLSAFTETFQNLLRASSTDTVLANLKMLAKKHANFNSPLSAGTTPEALILMVNKVLPNEADKFNDSEKKNILTLALLSRDPALIQKICTSFHQNIGDHPECQKYVTSELQDAITSSGDARSRDLIKVLIQNGAKVNEDVMHSADKSYATLQKTKIGDQTLYDFITTPAPRSRAMGVVDDSSARNALGMFAPDSEDKAKGAGKHPSASIEISHPPAENKSSSKQNR